MKNRIKKIRKELELTQQEFADKLGIARGNVGAYEVGKNAPSDAVISLICREFNVNEEWLREGTGEMFAEKPEDDFLSSAVASILNEDDALAIEGLKLYFSLTPEEKRTAASYVLRLADMIRSHGSDTPAASAAVEFPTKEDAAPAAIEAPRKETVGELEAAYEKNLGIAPKKGYTPSNTTGAGMKRKESGA